MIWNLVATLVLIFLLPLEVANLDSRSWLLVGIFYAVILWRIWT